MPKRTPIASQPIKLQKREWVSAPKLIVMGVDPGLASTGLAILEKAPGKKASCLKLKVIRTKKADKKDRRNLRVTADDSRRLKEIRDGLAELFEDLRPQALAFEVYSPYGAQGGSAWKTARVEGAVQMFGLEREILVLPFLPQDLKRGFCGRVGASKVDVQTALCEKVDDLRTAIQNFPKTVQEHVADAAGHAYLAFEEILRMRAMLGL